MGLSLRSALIAVQVMVVVQLGFAMMPECFLTSSGLISGTTSGTSGQSLNALELSTKTAPAALISSANAAAMLFSAAPRTMLSPLKFSAQASSTSWPSISCPAERLLASSRSSPTGKLRSRKIFSISRPTAPVAPRIPTLYLSITDLHKKSRPQRGRLVYSIVCSAGQMMPAINSAGSAAFALAAHACISDTGRSPVITPSPQGAMVTLSSQASRPSKRT